MTEFSPDNPIQSNIRKKALRLLGYYNDEGIIQQLKKDITNSNPEAFSSLMGDYQTKYLARVIESHRNDLFYLQEALIKKGQNDLADMLATIRTYAVEHENDSLEYLDPSEALQTHKTPSKETRGKR